MESIEYDFVLGRDYPHPIVDVQESNRKAREILYSIKKAIDPEDRNAIFQKHGSRKKPTRKSTSRKSKSESNLDNLSLF
jgi:deoxyribodipyrimidine photo-lyase